MPLKIKKRGQSKYVVTDGKRTFGTHASRKKAARQIAAIEANKRGK